MTQAKPKPLSCGGKGPCCHLGYSHRHCEHCDEVIDTRPANRWYVPYQPITVYPRPYWANGNYNNIGDVISTQTTGAYTQLDQRALAGEASGTMYMEAINASHKCEATG